MTKELLEQYPDICAEIEELKAKDSAAVSDVVQIIISLFIDKIRIWL